MDPNLSEFLTHFNNIRNTKELKDLNTFLVKNLFYSYFISCAFIACSSDCLETFIEILGVDDAQAENVGENSHKLIYNLDVDNLDTITTCNANAEDKGFNLNELSKKINNFRGKEIRFNEGKTLNDYLLLVSRVLLDRKINFPTVVLIDGGKSKRNRPSRRNRSSRLRRSRTNKFRRV
jgi:hypothetical protein